MRTTDESPFRLTYGTEAVLPIKLTKLTWRTDASTDFPANTANLREELEFVDEVRIGATLREAALKQKNTCSLQQESHQKRIRSRRPRPPAKPEGFQRREARRQLGRPLQDPDEDRDRSLQTRRPPSKCNSKDLECRKTQKVLHLDGKTTTTHSNVRT
jgi:hypothetical protein